MPDTPTKEFTIWLLNTRRARWSILLLVVAIGATMTVLQAMTAWHLGPLYFWLGLGSYGIAVMALYRRFTKWASDPATAVVSAKNLVVHSDATGFTLAVSYDAVIACTYGTIKDVASLRIDYLNDTKIFLRTFYGQNTFGKMAMLCEQYCKMHWLRVRLSQSRARR